jgi:hypothetical protein
VAEVTEAKPSKIRGAANAERYAAEIKAQLNEAWLPRIYLDRIRKMRTRSYKFDGSPKGKIEIQHTLLGVELKVGRRRLLCPDLSTARYLAVFARAGCSNVAVPYDITRISQLADQLESSWHRMLLLVNHSVGVSERLKNRIRTSLINRIRLEVEAAGAGPSTPEFKQSTKQRR